MIDGRNFFDQPIRNDIKTWKYQKKCNWSKRWLHNWLLTWLPLFQKNCKLIVIDVSKEQLLDADQKPMQQINFSSNFNRERDTAILLLYEEAKETILNFFTSKI